MACATPLTQPNGGRVPEPVLTIEDLRVEFSTEDGIVKAVDGVSYEVYPGETLGVVGESGSGKSVTVMSILGLIPRPPGKIVGGRAMFKGHDLLTAGKEDLRRIRGKEIAMVFQDPMTSLNPVFKVGEQLEEAIKIHDPAITDQDSRRKSIELLEL